MRFHRHLDRSSRLPCADLVGNFTFYGVTHTIVGASVPRVIRAFGSTLSADRRNAGGRSSAARNTT